MKKKYQEIEMRIYNIKSNPPIVCTSTTIPTGEFDNTISDDILAPGDL